MTYLKLTIAPIPYSSSMASLAKLLPKEHWDKIRKTIYKQAGYRCRICGKAARLHCHEVWNFNERTGYQWLMGFTALCEDCHGVKHILSIRNPETIARLTRHFMFVNKVDETVFQQHLQAARQKRAELSKREWIIQFGNYNFLMPSLKTLEQRRRYVGVGRNNF